MRASINRYAIPDQLREAEKALLVSLPQPAPRGHYRHLYQWTRERARAVTLPVRGVVPTAHGTCVQLRAFGIGRELAGARS